MKWSCDVHAITVLVLVFAVIRSLTESLCISVHARTVFTPSAVGLLFYHEICDLEQSKLGSVSITRRYCLDFHSIRTSWYVRLDA